MSHNKNKQKTHRRTGKKDHYEFFSPNFTFNKSKTEQEKVRDEEDILPIDEDLSQREGQGGVLSHLQDQTVALTHSHGGITAVCDMKRKLLQDVHFICWEKIKKTIIT